MRWLGGAVVVLLACAVAVLLPAAWVQGGWVPDLAVLAVLYLALRADAERAALLGIAIGLVAGLWSPDPFALRAFSLGLLGWVVAHADRSFVPDRIEVRVVLAGAGAFAVRVLEIGLGRTVLGPDAAVAEFAPWAASLLPEGAAALPPVSVLPSVADALTVSVATALAAPLLLWVLERSRLLGGFCSREVRGV